MNGIGGRTIAEAQERISTAEYETWLRYRAKRGTLNLGMRVEWGASMLAALYANSHRGKSTPAYRQHDFAPHMDAPGISLEQAMEQWQ